MGGDFINSYDDANRGEFQHEEFAKQLVSFTGMRFEGENGDTNVTPTDIDGLIQLSKENCIIFFELKHSGDVPYGQRKALERMCDGLESGGIHSVVFVAAHNTPKDEAILAKDAKVTQVYWNKKWVYCPGTENLYDKTKNYIKYIKEKHERQFRLL